MSATRQHPDPDPDPDGTEPDYRFTLANERTFLAWIRTAMGLLAGGVAAQQLVPQFGGPATRTVLAVLFLALSAMLAGVSYPRWRKVQSAMRRGEPLPGNSMIVALATGILAITVFCAILVVTS
jgi:putative membrane protein